MTHKRQRRETETVEFSDPLKRYEGIEPVDDLERALCEGTVSDVTPLSVAIASPIDTIESAVKRMAEMDIGCLVIVEMDRLVGIFTQSDLLRRVVDRYDLIKGTLLRDVMTVFPAFVRDTDSPAKAINLMSTGGFRHVPVLDVDDRVVGIIGPRRVTQYLRKHLG